MSQRSTSDSTSILPRPSREAERRDKISSEELAIAGGAPSFSSTLHVGRPNIGSRQALRERIDDILDNKWLSNSGPYLQEFESQVERLLGVRHCIATCNGTMALQLLLHSLDLKGEVIVPSFTFVATVNAISWEGLTPVFCDIDPRTHCLDPGQVVELITPDTVAILGVHLWGQPCYVEELQSIASEHGLHLIYDAAHAFLCSTAKGEFLGNFGLAEILSFHATKFINTFEGGAIVTNNDPLASKLRSIRNFGFAGLDATDCLGINAKMSEVSAAMGITSIESRSDFVDANKRNHQAYKLGLCEVAGTRLLGYDAQGSNNYQYIVVEIDSGIAGVTRDQIVEVLYWENIFARRYFYPGCHRLEPYKSNSLYRDIKLPCTDALGDSILLLPTGTSIAEADILCICNLMRLAMDYFSVEAPE